VDPIGLSEDFEDLAHALAVADAISRDNDRVALAT
jgi:hypothetical protein